MCHKLIIVTQRESANCPLAAQVERLLTAWKAPHGKIPAWLRQAREIRVLLREVDLDADRYFVLAEKLQKICHAYGAVFTVHSHIAIARTLKAELHLPTRFLKEWEEPSVAVAGTSLHSIDELRFVERHQKKLSYAMLSPIFPTSCKPGIKPKGAEIFASFPRIAGVSYYALGGIAEENFHLPLQFGADGVALMGAAMRWKQNK